MTEQIEIRRLTTMDELHDMQHVEEAVWDMPPTPVHQTHTALHNGGIILGAFTEEKMIGFLYSFAGFDGKNAYLCSHMLGIISTYRKGGLGMRMKFKQADIAKSLGYTKITWTFDPLESLNAYLNLHKLGANGAYYKENHYGSMDDGLNQGLPTDRIKIEWNLDKEQTKKDIHFDEAKLLLRKENDHPVVTDTFTNNFSKNEGGWFVTVPAHFQLIKQQDIQLAKNWRYETRKVFQALYSEGYQAKDFIHDGSNDVSYYYFSK
ncbi:GNAT family N-acetyltransferase [Virgibacillus byunsanensis]|uniref:GNAT family N-acetyltransferase n=1 Tax=Virgibacillus byunsanensis TaxID=570945 RepID=A0ABW3LU37_9BACI